MGTSEAWISRNLRAIFITYLTVGVGLTVALLLGAQKPLTLFKRTEYVSPQVEMTEEQRQKVAFVSNPEHRIKELTHVRMNRWAFMGHEVTVEMPDGNDYTLTGGLMKNGAGFGEMLCWSGQISQVFPGGVVAYSGSGHGCFEADHIDGQFFVGGKHFGLTDNGDHQLLLEAMPSQGWYCPTPPDPSRG